MVSRELVERLSKLRSEDGIVSFYAWIEPRLMHRNSQLAAKFKGALRSLERRADEHALAAVQREKDRILKFLREWRPQGRALALFACEPASLWETVNLAVPVPTFLEVDATTHTGPLTRVLDEYPRLVVINVQRDMARIYIAEQGGSERATDIASEVPGKHDQGGWAQARMQRHIEIHFKEHLKEIAHELERIEREHGSSRIALGGTQEATRELQELLPESIRDRVIGVFPVDFKHESDDDIARKAARLHEEYERGTEVELVQQIFEAADSNGAGVVGVSGTLDAVLGGKVRTFVLIEEAEAQGSECQNCEYLSSESFESCPMCGGPSVPMPNVVERALERAYRSGAHVEFVYGKAREMLLAKGGVGALLRY